MLDMIDVEMVVFEMGQEHTEINISLEGGQAQKVIGAKKLDVNLLHHCKPLIQTIFLCITSYKQ